MCPVSPPLQCELNKGKHEENQLHRLLGAGPVSRETQEETLLVV